MSVDLRCGDSFDLLKTLSDNSVDTVITDPPAGISFMGKDWDTFPVRKRELEPSRGARKDGGSMRGFANGFDGVNLSPTARDAFIEWLSAILAECYRVAKPGAMLLCWALPRTSHWTGTAIENAGWEVRDVISHLFGSGFPKSLDISKALDKVAGAERTEVIGARHRNVKPYDDGNGWNANNTTGDHEYTAPATPAAREWDGYGTALKPSAEFWWLAMKPVDGTFAQNALKWGVAGLNVDAGRIGLADGEECKPMKAQQTNNCIIKQSGRYTDTTELKPSGRFPSHVVLSHSPNCNGSCADDCPVRLLDEQSGNKTGAHGGNGNFRQHSWMLQDTPQKIEKDNTGGASRFFKIVENDSRFLYCSKASRRERDAGLEGMPERTGAELTGRKEGSAGLVGDKNNRGQTANPFANGVPIARNHHPTVKPLTLMEYLCNLTRTPTGGVVLDPFMGSGSTIVAAIRTGRGAIGFESRQEYFEIAQARARHAQREKAALLL